VSLRATGAARRRLHVERAVKAALGLAAAVTILISALIVVSLVRPSIDFFRYGILGLAFVARGPLDLGFAVLTAALILTMVVLPTVVIASREAIRAVPSSLRDGALALGATRWQTVSRQILPSAVPGIATGSILATSRALGESAPLLWLGAMTFVTFNPDGFDSTYTVLPLQIFRFISHSKDEFRPLAAAASVVLLTFLIVMNSVAIIVRNRFQRKW